MKKLKKVVHVDAPVGGTPQPFVLQLNRAEPPKVAQFCVAARQRKPNALVPLRQRKRGKNVDERPPPRLPQRAAVLVAKRDANLYKPLERLPPPKRARQLRAVVLVFAARQKPLPLADKVAKLVQHVAQKVPNRVKQRQKLGKLAVRQRVKRVVDEPPKLRVQRPLVVPKVEKHVQKQIDGRRLVRTVAKPVHQRAKPVRNEVCRTGRPEPKSKPKHTKSDGLPTPKPPPTKRTLPKSDAKRTTTTPKPDATEPARTGRQPEQLLPPVAGQRLPAKQTQPNVAQPKPKPDATPNPTEPTHQPKPKSDALSQKSDGNTVEKSPT